MDAKLTSEEYAQILQTIEMFEVISQAEPVSAHFIHPVYKHLRFDDLIRPTLMVIALIPDDHPHWQESEYKYRTRTAEAVEQDLLTKGCSVRVELEYEAVGAMVDSQAEQVEEFTLAGAESQIIGTTEEIQSEVEDVFSEAKEIQAEQAIGSAPAGAEENQAERVESSVVLTEGSQAEQVEAFPDLEIEVAPLSTDDPTHGGTFRDAEYWGVLLVKHFGAARYQSFVVPTLLKDRYGVVLVDKANGKKCEYRTYTEIGKKISPPKRRNWQH